MRRIARLGLALIAIVVAQGQGSEEARRSYNTMYKDPAKVFSTAPNAFLREVIAGKKPGRALDIGMGQGRNALWLAEQGWDVTGIDVSDEGLSQAKAEAARQSLRLRTERVEYDAFNYGERQWDLIVLCYFLPRELPSKLLAALKPGGLVVVEGFHADTSFVRLLPGGFADNELLKLFAGYRTLRYEDVEAPAEWGGALGEGNRVVRLVAQRPMDPPLACSFAGRTVPRGRTACWGPMQMRCEVSGWARSGTCENNGKND